MTAILRCWILAILGAGCVEEGLVRCVDSVDAEDSDEIEIVVTMSEDASFETVCRPATIQISGSDLEYRVAIAPGPRYAKRAFLRAEQRRAGQDVAIREFEAPIVEGEQKEWSVFLYPFELCGEEDACAVGQEQCLEGRCTSLLHPAGWRFENGDVAIEPTTEDECDTSP